LAAIAREVGGDKVEAVALARGDYDPHQVAAYPSLMVEANKADLFVEIGLELELWAEHIIDGARNPKIRRTEPGHVWAAAGVHVVEKPAELSRAQGDVHPNGNPHVWNDPPNAIVEARNIADGLARVDPANQAYYDARFEDFKARVERALFGEDLVKTIGAPTLMKLLEKGTLADFLASKKYKGKPLADRLGGWYGKMWPCRGAKVFSFHKEFSYFARTFELDVVANLEPKPGIPPTPGHLEELEKIAREQPIRAVIIAPYNNVALTEGFCKKTGIPLCVVPTDVGGTEDARDYFSLMDGEVNRIAEAIQKSGK
ncbi:MAG TPA: metal ABC transporter substrate-binding protein, partial [Planctomycetota bacterium]|nr:metal ABC transporter substrate-binding protein [Planctomycetota bacterium]